MAKTVPLEAPWTAPDAAQWDFQPFSEWVAANVSSSQAQVLVERGVTGVFNSGPGPLSLLAALFVTRSAQDLIRHFHPLGADQRLVGGAQQLATMMAQRLNGKVFTNAYVYQINHNAGGVEVIADRITVRARRVIVTLPRALAGRMRFDPPLPASRDHLTQSTPMGWVIKVHCTYPTRFWHDAGLSGGVTSDEGAIRTTADNSLLRVRRGFWWDLLKEPRREYLPPPHSPNAAAPPPRTSSAILAEKRPTQRIISNTRGATIRSLAVPMVAIGPKACGPPMAPTSERRSVASIGRVPRRPRNGTARWRAPCNQASTPRPRF
jgi:hypothetical protein